MMISENEEERKGDSGRVLLCACEMEHAKSARSEETVLQIDSAEWFVIMLRSSSGSVASEESSREFAMAYSRMGVAMDTTRRLFSVIVPVLSERTCLQWRSFGVPT